MPTHDIIDNRDVKLVDHIKRILDSSESAQFAVGYFFLSGFESIVSHLDGINEVRLLIGNTTNRQTLEQMAEGYRRLELVAKAAEAQNYPKRTDSKRIALESGDGVRASLELMDQTDESEALIKTLAQMIETERLKVRVYTKGRLHAKAYIFNYGPVFDASGNELERHENGIAIVGSSNLTLSGVSHSTELNVVVQGNDNHAELTRWFDSLWKESQKFDEILMSEMQQSWAIVPARPYDIYMKTIYALIKDRLEGDDNKEILWDDEITRKLADFQKVAVRQAVQMIRDYGGAFIADVVGLGKSYIGAAIVKHFERTFGARPLIVCPAPLVEMWERYNEVYELNARVLSMGLLTENENATNILLEDAKFRGRDFVLIDESHNFRHSDTQRYKLMQGFLATGRRCCLLTATPRNKSAWDVYYQIKLFHWDDKTDLPIDPPNLREYFKLVEKNGRNLQDMLIHLLIRRTRTHILRWYGFDSETHQPVDPARFSDYIDGNRKAYVLVGGRHQFFPTRELETIEYSIEDTYQGLYRQLRGYFGGPGSALPDDASPNELSFARYGLWLYVLPEHQKQEPYVSLHRAGANLRGLIRVMLFKRFESSVFAFQETIRRLILVHQRFLEALENGFVPAGEDAQSILYEPSRSEEQDLMDALRMVSNRYRLADFEEERLRADIERDVHLLQKIEEIVSPITPDKDAKLQTLLRRLKRPPLKGRKRLIFTQYADTARYLYENINPDGEHDDIEVIFSGDKSKTRVVGRFAPKANPEYRFAPGEAELNTVIATDILAEGLNLQDCDSIVSYDLHWNPVRLIQRFGRIDRIGSEHDTIRAFNFLPETGIEKNLGLRDKLEHRIQEIHDTIGEDSAILDRNEQLNTEAMYAIYEKDGAQLNLFEDEGGDIIGLNEAEEIFRQLRHDDPAEFERIASLRDGIRSAKPSKVDEGLFVFCEATYPDRPGLKAYQQLFLLDSDGEIVSKDIPRMLGAIKCGPELEAGILPADFNNSIMKVKRQFAEEVEHRQAEREYTLSLTHGQRYSLRELRILFGTIEDEDLKAQINILDRAFRGPVTTALKKELNVLRRNNVTGRELLDALSRLYHQHNMHEWVDRRSSRLGDRAVARIVCSQAFV